MENRLVTHVGLSHLQPRLIRLSLIGLSVAATTAAPLHSAHAHLLLAANADPTLVHKADPEAGEETLPQRRPDPNAAPIDLESYAYQNLFSIGFPKGWQITEQEASPQITALAPAQGTTSTPALRTEVTWYPTPPQEIVPQALQSIQQNRYTVARYDAINVDGTTALRIWLTDLPEAATPNAFMSYVGYQNGTAVIASYYGDRNPDLDNLLSQIHQSFKRVTEP